jgi:hypothetical protein
MTKIFRRTEDGLVELESISGQQRKTVQRSAPIDTELKKAENKKRLKKLKRKRIKLAKAPKRYKNSGKKKRSPFASKERTLYTVGGSVIRSVVSGGLPSLGKKR